MTIEPIKNKIKYLINKLSFTANHWVIAKLQAHGQNNKKIPMGLFNLNNSANWYIL
jgi:hypothetical protein